MDEMLSLAEIARKYHVAEKYVYRVLASVDQTRWASTLVYLSRLGEGMIEETSFTSANPLGSKIELPEKFPAQLFP